MAGRPTLYKPEYCEEGRKLCLLGHTDSELAAFFEISESTLNLWKIEFPEFSESLKSGKEIADGNVAEGMYRRAVGIEFDEVTFEKIDSKEMFDIEGVAAIKDDQFKKKVVTKYIPPDTGAALSWLKNRQKKKWRDKIETGFTDMEGNDIPVHIFQLPDNGRNKSDTTAAGLPDEGTQQ